MPCHVHTGLPEQMHVDEIEDFGQTDRAVRVLVDRHLVGGRESERMSRPNRAGPAYSVRPRESQ